MNRLEEINNKGRATIVKTIRQFSLTTCLFSGISAIFYLILRMYQPAIIVSIIGLLFLLIYYFNKKNKHTIARIIAIFATNLGVLLFSINLGFNTGFYLYLFASPQLIYLLFKLRQKKLVYICIGINLLTFLIIFLIDWYKLIKPQELTTNVISLLYSLNFGLSLILSFILVAIFAKNNKVYIDLLKEANEELEEQQEVLKNKNNLAVVAGLLDLQNVFVKEKAISDILKDSKNRIKSIALLHEKLYVHKDLDKINVEEYINELIYFIKLSYKQKNINIQIETAIESIHLSMETALPFSLLVNELVTNSYKHAFLGKENGSIKIDFKTEGEFLMFKYIDDGLGFDFDEKLKTDSIGTNLINAFASQLNGEFINNTKLGSGCEMILRFTEITE
ncbi:MAG: sensor histidine kinase [Fluviicola sp.]|nr:sensor histidine kinase [Fluviicola sp.]